MTADADPPATPLAEQVLKLTHDARTPLTAVRGYADIVMRGSQTLSGEERDDLLARIVSNATRLDELITALADAARADVDAGEDGAGG